MKIGINFNMFKKIECQKCGRKIEGKYSFCPYCGDKINPSTNNEDWGMLGKDDFTPFMNEVKLPMGFNALFNSIMKSLTKEFDEQLSKNAFQTDEKQPRKIKKDGISISISTFGDGQPKIKVTPLGNNQKQEIENNEKFKQNSFTKEKIKKFASLERKEPKTNIRRLSNGVIYELDMPGVNSIEDISIIKLENSIEIKAIAKNKAYSKIIQINLPLKNYNLSEGKLILELGIKN